MGPSIKYVCSNGGGVGWGGQAKSVHILVKEIIPLSKNVHGGGGRNVLYLSVHQIVYVYHWCCFVLPFCLIMLDFKEGELMLDISMLELSDYLPIALNYFLIFVKFCFSLWEEY